MLPPMSLTPSYHHASQERNNAVVADKSTHSDLAAKKISISRGGVMVPQPLMTIWDSLLPHFNR